MMPVGCLLNHLIIRKSSVERALLLAHHHGQIETEQFLQTIMDRQHQDEHLIAFEDVGEDDFFLSSLKLAGLIHDDGENCIDFYSPYSGCQQATWLEVTQIKNVAQPPADKVMYRWTAYRLVGDIGRTVVLEIDESLANYQPEDFPIDAEKVVPKTI
jgi:hypothetical protein